MPLMIIIYNLVLCGALVGGEAAQGGEVAQEAVLRWTPSEDVLRHLCLDSRGLHLMSLLR